MDLLPKSAKTSLHNERFTILLGFMLLFMLVDPFFDGSRFGRVLDIVYLLVLLSCINVVSTYRPAFYSVLILTAMGYGGNFVARSASQPARYTVGPGTARTPSTWMHGSSPRVSTGRRPNSWAITSGESCSNRNTTAKPSGSPPSKWPSCGRRSSRNYPATPATTWNCGLLRT